MRESYQLALLLVPKAERKGFEARKQRNGFDALKERVRVMTLLKIVVRYPRTQMVEMVIPDITGEPLENLRQLVK